ncbi:dipeptide ABC transporter ATP-binding protein [Pseudonocardia oroxyli]|uniref:Peptide/nickel transport system ATP-binding protein n=1 Tax=Pseudonocardia oroxyli TaxID=366584 RepID=A0A1G8CAM6_PSEOR|nr:ABC transporter ATP-binding protein [Pseudonocardia oroxyli]SDH42531.1 peptide/nickel transport system ATP-binding protein [Pseudonocardia oroxyli]
MSPVLTVEGLAVRYGAVEAVRGVSFHVDPGETVAIVGESGSGKSTLAHAALGLLPAGATVTAGRVLLRDTDLAAADDRELRHLRGRTVALVPQDPGASLDPVMRVGPQVAEVLEIHGLARGRAAALRAREALARAGLQPEQVADRYPHELSGGMRQRVLIAAALAADPALIVADEPTSALDVTVQKQILDHLTALTAKSGTSLLFVTHDLAVAAERADRVLVMRAGELVESGHPAQVFDAPRHPYTRELAAAAPGLDGPTARAGSTTGAPLMVLEGIDKTYPSRGGRTVDRPAVDSLDLAVSRGRTLALVGESGSGKTTVGRLVLRLLDPDTGRILFDGADVTSARGSRLRALRRRVQLVQQNPFTALNPRLTVEALIADPLHAHRIGSSADRRRRAAELVEVVRLPADTLHRRAAELSGGQRQRVAIARAIALDPELIVLDEPVSALDVSVQARILDLLRGLQRERDIGYLFITHDLAVAREIAHDVAVMRAGRLVERGPAATVLSEPRDPYTRALLDAVPDPRRHRPVTTPAHP